MICPLNWVGGVQDLKMLAEKVVPYHNTIPYQICPLTSGWYRSRSGALLSVWNMLTTCQQQTIMCHGPGLKLALLKEKGPGHWSALKLGRGFAFGNWFWCSYPFRVPLSEKTTRPAPLQPMLADPYTSRFPFMKLQWCCGCFCVTVIKNTWNKLGYFKSEGLIHCMGGGANGLKENKTPIRSLEQINLFRLQAQLGG